MSTDRELLEAAAKAANNGAVWVETAYEETFKVPYETGNAKGWEPWNPLTDDGDALRLAVKLRLQVRIEDYGTSARPISKLPEAWVGCETHKMGGDHAAATRRAIVRAAATLGGES